MVDKNKTGSVTNKKLWIDVSLLNLCTVAFLGMVLRSKILFSLPAINYNHLLDAHAHFAFGAWVTLALMVLMVSELLPGSSSNKIIYQWLFAGIALTSWGMLFSFYLAGNSLISNLLSTIFILVTYYFAWIFIKHIRKAEVTKTVLMLSVAALICLVLSSTGPFALAYLFASKSLNVILYRDALFTYLHFQYNGFFTLSVFALLFHKIELKITDKAKKNIYRFAIFLCISIIPSLFLSYLWQDPNITLRAFAIVGSILVFLSFIFFVFAAFSLKNIYSSTTSFIRHIGLLSMCAFTLKIFLQSFTIFPAVGNAVFGNRPMIIGFLHLVFLGFVSLFLLGYFAQERLLNIKSKFTKFAIIVFTAGVILNEAALMGQGLGVMFFKNSYLFQWLLWGISIMLFAGALLIGMARIKTKTLSIKHDLKNQQQ